MKENKIKTPGIIGIDAGGTYTDLAFISSEDWSVQARVKTPTNHDDMVKTIEEGLDLILENIDAAAICSFNLATTLATNAIVENKLRKAALILIGYNETIVKNAVADGALHADGLFLVGGGHNQRGEEKESLNEEQMRKKIAEIPDNVEAVAISSFFSVRNPSHENRAAEILQELRPDLYISCGHELSTDLDAIKRATTTMMNAGLIPIVMELLASVEDVCNRKGIQVPITIVRGDGTIVGAPWAKMHPVEMVLSGPAASACGARFLALADADERGTFIVDIGGTTTDIIRLDGKGKPVLLEEGAIVAGHKTLVKAIDICTFGLGGDSRIIYDDAQTLTMGYRRVRSLCSLAHEHPHIIEELKMLLQKGHHGEPLFLIRGSGDTEDAFEAKILANLEDGPHAIEVLLFGENTLWLKHRQIERMEEKGLIQYASFTPTDALHVLGLLEKWNQKASILGARLIAPYGRSANDVALYVRNLVVNTIGRELLKQSLAMKGFALLTGGEGQRLIDAALRDEGNVSRQIQLMLDKALVGAGAPSWAFIPFVGESLHEAAILPDHADVAGAVGAAVGSFSLVYSVQIMPLKESDRFRVHYPLGIADFSALEEAVDYACEFMNPWLTDRALNAGAVNPRINTQRYDKTASINGIGGEIYLYTRLIFEVTDFS